MVVTNNSNGSLFVFDNTLSGSGTLLVNFSGSENGTDLYAPTFKIQQGTTSEFTGMVELAGEKIRRSFISLIAMSYRHQESALATTQFSLSAGMIPLRELSRWVSLILREENSISVTFKPAVRLRIRRSELQRN